MTSYETHRLRLRGLARAGGGVVAETPGRWFVAPPGWEPDQPNPFAADGTYGPRWSCFHLTGADDDWIRNGCEPSGLHVAAFGRRCEEVEQRLSDFLHYETAHGRNVIVSGPLDISAEVLVNRALALPLSPTAIRSADPRWVVHSTTLEAWTAIQSCGALCSFARLRGSGKPERALGEVLLGDPPDYTEYVAFGRTEAIGSEFVVACRQAGKMLSGPDTQYEPGVRLYFDAHRILRDGLAVRDGLHTLKVHGCLPLQPYLVLKVAADDLPPLAAGEQWTTSMFLQRANEAFERRAGVG